MPRVLSWVRRWLQALPSPARRPADEDAALLPPAATTLVAIAKNERRYLPEWIAFHLSIGIDRIVVYDNDSSDDGAAIVRALGRHFPFMAYRGRAATAHPRSSTPIPTP